MADPLSANESVPARIMPTVPDIIARVESSAFLGAVRYEPATYAHHAFKAATILSCMLANQCNRTTALILLSMSFGQFQIMGFNLYDKDLCDYRSSIVDFLYSKVAQCAALSKFLKADLIGYEPRELLDPVKRAHFAEKYNGPGNVTDYSAKILAAAIALGVSA